MELIEFTNKINVHAARVRDLKSHATTEESTKNALINPFLQTLGYDTSDPRVVQFEYTADVGTKKGEKVDYAIVRDEKVIMVIEAKKAGCPLDAGKASQLRRYFHVTSARIAILTDGIVYEFYSDLDKDNVMDDKPFMVFDIESIDDKLIAELRKLANDAFDVDVALEAAQDLKHTRQIKQNLKQEFLNPSHDFIKLLICNFMDKRSFRANLLDDFKPKVKSAVVQYLNEELINRIQGVTKFEDDAEEEKEATNKADSVVTTHEEIEAYLIVKSILRKEVPLNKVIMRDTQSYCGILYDNNNRKPICRFYFNSDKVKYIAIVMDKAETKHKIDSIDDIYNYSDELIQSAQQYI